jgi:hypothetical protein
MVMVRRFCPLCGTSLVKVAKARRQRKVWITQQWQERNRKRYNEYQKLSQRRLRAKKRAAEAC